MYVMIMTPFFAWFLTFLLDSSSVASSNFCLKPLILYFASCKSLHLEWNFYIKALGLEDGNSKTNSQRLHFLLIFSSQLIHT